MAAAVSDKGGAPPAPYRPGPRNLITDVPGIRVGHATDEAVRTGVTVILPDALRVAAVDLRGGGPATRETELLASRNLLGRVHALVLSGGSVFGLGAADGVVAALSAQDCGLRFQAGSPAIPLVPAASLHDLGNGGDKAWGAEPPYRRLGRDALMAATADFALGSVGAGRGAMAGIMKGGVGSASLDLGGGLVVGALAAVNCIGGATMPGTDIFWAWPFEIDGEFGGRRPDTALAMAATEPLPEESRLGGAGRLELGANTTLAVVATSALWSQGEAERVAVMAQDGMARAVRPSHTPFDGDLVFAVATERVALREGLARHRDIARVGAATADCLTRAIARGVYAAEG